jgi:PAS domain S-box-containing protein
MKDQSKTKQTLIQELTSLRQRIAELEQSESVRKPVEYALWKSKEELQWLLKSMINAFVLFESVFDDNGHFISYRFVYINDAYERITGVKNEEVKGKTVHEVWPETEPGWIKRYGEVAVTGATQTFELYHDPTKKLYHCNVYRPWDTKDHFCVIFEDITERKRAEETLRERDIQFKKLSSWVPGMIYQFTKRPDGTYCMPFTTEAIKDIFGCSPQDVREDFSPIARVILPEDFDKVIGSIEDSAKHLTIWTCEYRVQIPGQSIRWMLGHSTPEKLADGGITWHGFITDITDRKQAEETLRESESRYKSLFENNHAVMLLIDPDNAAIMDANPAACTYYGWSREELMKRRIDEINTLGSEEVAAEMQLARSEKRNQFFFKHRRADDTIRDVEVYSRPISLKGKALLYSIVHDITERKLAEEALRESEEKYRLIAENTADLISILDMNLRFTYVSPASMRLRGFTVEEAMEQTLEQVLTPESMRLALTVFEKELQLEASGTDDPDRTRILELEEYKKDGSIIWVEVSLSFLRDKDGKPVKILIVSRDITDRKQAEEVLWESEERYRTLVEKASEAIYVAQDGMLKFVNRAGVKIAGYSEQELISKPFIEFIHPDDRAMVGERYLKRLKGEGFKSRYTFRFIAKNGDIKWLELGAALINFEGRPATLNVVTDITDRKWAEHALHRSEENFRHSLDDSPLGVRIVTTEGETIYANQAILDIYGIEDLKTTLVKKLYTPESFAEYQIRREKRKRGDYVPSEYEISIVRKNGEVRHLQVFRKDILWNGERQFQVLYNDITDRKLAEEKIKASLLEKETMLKEIHHRVKNNLQVISSLLALQSGYVQDEKSREIFQESQDRVSTMAKIHTMLCQSENMSGVDFGGFIGDLAGRLQQSYGIAESRVGIHVNVDVSLTIETSIPCGLILNELVSNALKHAFPEGRGGEVNISMMKAGDRFVLTVQDNGIGFPEALDFHNTKSLGLELVNLLVGQMNGAITLIVEGGATFTITFPAVSKEG